MERSADVSSASREMRTFVTGGRDARGTSTDRFLFGLLLVLVLLISSIPSFYGFLSAPPDTKWTGILPQNSADLNGYLSIIEEVRQGHLRSRNLFTAESHPPFQIRPCFMALGLLGRLFPQISNVALLELGRILSTTCFLLILVLLVRHLFLESIDRVIGFLILSLGSGFGWLHLEPIPLDLGLVESSTFLTLTAPPLYTLSLSLVLGILLCVERSWNSENGMRWSVVGGILALWIGFDRPFSLFTIFIAVASALIVESVRARRFQTTKFLLILPVMIGAAISLAYQEYSVSKIPVYAEWNRQHILPTPKILSVLSAFGLLLPGAILGIKPLFSSQRTLGALVGSYIIASLLLIQSPLTFQVRFLEGLPLFLALCTVYAVTSGIHRIDSPTLRTMAAAILVALLIPASFAAVAHDLEVIVQQRPPQYMPMRAIAAMRQLALLAASDETILSSESSGNFIAGYAARPVVIGHRIATARYIEKRALVVQFFQLDARDARSAVLFDRTGATWLFWGPEEAWLARGSFNPKYARFLQPRYSNGLITLYRKKDFATEKK